jgi:hypothetical protein
MPEIQRDSVPPSGRPSFVPPTPTPTFGTTLLGFLDHVGTMTHMTLRTLRA